MMLQTTIFRAQQLNYNNINPNWVHPSNHFTSLQKKKCIKGKVTEGHIVQLHK